MVIERGTAFLDGAGCSGRIVCDTPAGLGCVCVVDKLSSLVAASSGGLSQFPAMVSRSCRSFSSMDSNHWHLDCRVCVSISK